MGLERHLADQRQAGKLESSGQFTLSPEAALEKLSQHGLAQAELAPLQLIQLALRLGCTEARLLHRTFDLELTLVGARLDAARLDFERFNRLSGRDQTERFTLALLSCLYGGFERLELLYEDHRWLLEQGGHQRRRLKSATSDPRIRLTREQPAAFWERLGALLKGRCLDHRLLSERLPYSPVPIWLDNRNLRPPALARCLLELELLGPPERLAEGVKAPPPRTARHRLAGKKAEVGSRSWQTFLSVRQKAALKYFGGRRPGLRQEGLCHLGHLWVPASMPALGKRIYVAGGVVVAEEVFAHPLGVQVVVSAAGLDTDLSGLRLVDNDKKKRLDAYLERCLDKAIERLVTVSPHPPKRLLQRLLDRLPDQAARLAQLEKRHTPAKKPPRKKTGSGASYTPTAAFADEYKTVRRQQRERGI